MGDEVVGGAVGLERAGERRVELRGFHRIDEAGLGGGFDERVRSDSVLAGDGDGAGKEKRDGAEILGDDVVLLGHRVFSKGEYGEAETVASELGGESWICQNLAGFEGDSPCG